MSGANKEALGAEEKLIRGVGMLAAAGVATGTAVVALTQEGANLPVLYLVLAVCLVQATSVATYALLHVGSALATAIARLALSVNSSWVALHSWTLWVRGADGSEIVWLYEAPVLLVCLGNALYFLWLLVQEKKRAPAKKKRNQ